MLDSNLIVRRRGMQRLKIRYRKRYTCFKHHDYIHKGHKVFTTMMITNKFFGDKSLGTYKTCMVELNGTLKKIKMIDNHFWKI